MHYCNLVMANGRRLSNTTQSTYRGKLASLGTSNQSAIYQSLSSIYISVCSCCVQASPCMAMLGPSGIWNKRRSAKMRQIRNSARLVELIFSRRVCARACACTHGSVGASGALWAWGAGTGGVSPQESLELRLVPREQKVEDSPQQQKVENHSLETGN